MSRWGFAIATERAFKVFEIDPSFTFHLGFAIIHGNRPVDRTIIGWGCTHTDRIVGVTDIVEEVFVIRGHELIVITRLANLEEF